MHDSRLTVGRHVRVRNVMIAMMIGINFGWIWAYTLAERLKLALFSVFAPLFLVILVGSLSKAGIWRNLAAQWAGL